MNIYEPRKDTTPILTVQPTTVSGSYINTGVINIYVCDLQDIRSSFKMGNMVIYLPVKVGIFKKFMFKHCFGLDLKCEEARDSAC